MVMCSTTVEDAAGAKRTAAARPIKKEPVYLGFMVSPDTNLLPHCQGPRENSGQRRHDAVDIYEINIQESADRAGTKNQTFRSIRVHICP
jgi:hypothetical protein